MRGGILWGVRGRIAEVTPPFAGCPLLLEPGAPAVIIISAVGAPEIQLVLGHPSAAGGAPLRVWRAGEVGASGG